jgi:alpha-galactosidase
VFGRFWKIEYWNYDKENCGNKRIVGLVDLLYTGANEQVFGCSCGYFEVDYFRVREGKTPPLSFVYDGKPSASFLKSWNYSLVKEKSDDPLVVQYKVTYVDPASGLRLDCRIKGFKEFNAIEWVLNFTNTSSENSAVIEHVNVVDFTALSRTEGDFIVYHAKGSDAKRSDFQPLETRLGAGEAVRMQPNGGRSSDDTGFPFFTIESPDHTGMVVAIGWSGNWFAMSVKPIRKHWV